MCPFCGGGGFGRVRRYKFKCYGCKKEWGVRRDSMLEGLRTPFAKFLMAVKLFGVGYFCECCGKAAGRFL